jgi:NADPH-dependent curcumin reductase CurA
MRGRMSAGPSYAPPVQIGAVMTGEVVGEVIQSRVAGFEPGDLVAAQSGWQALAAVPRAMARKLDPAIQPPSYALGVLGMPGFTAYHGLLNIGQPRPGETVVVAAATGGVGSVVGQIARLNGCRAVGIAGGADKCRHAVETLGFDACVDHRAADLPEQLKAACPSGVDIYFENVGGAVLEAVRPLLNDRARIPLCGLISTYNASIGGGDDGGTGRLLRTLLIRQVKLQGFLIGNHFNQLPAFQQQMLEWLGSGEVRYQEHRVRGLQNAPAAFLALLSGDHLGKVIVEADE